MKHILYTANISLILIAIAQIISAIEFSETITKSNFIFSQVIIIMQTMSVMMWVSLATKNNGK